jgi:hypothetical protein
MNYSHVMGINNIDTLNKPILKLSHLKIIME